jgi:hypothetical protein
MSSNTKNLGLYKKDPATDGNDTFNITTMLNENWDKLDKLVVREPFLAKSVVYDSTNDKIDVTLGPGIVDFLQTIITKTAEAVYSIPTPAINTSYYIYIKSDGTFSHYTTGAEVDGAVLLWIVATGSTVDALTTTDQRGQISGSAQAVKDLLDAHEAANDPHPQYETSSEAQAKADNAEANAKAYAITREAMERLDQNGVEVHRSGKDSNGKFTTIEVKRPDGTLFMKSVLSGTIDTNGNYPTRTESFYDESGVTELASIVYSRTFDADGDLITEVI